MMAETVCLQLPPDYVLESSENWENLGDKTYSTLRVHLVVVKRRTNKILSGPPVNVIDLPNASEYSFEHKKAKIVHHTIEINQSVLETFGEKFSAGLFQKIVSEIGITTGLPAAKLSGEIQNTMSAELTASVQSAVSMKRAFEVEEAEEINRCLTYKPSSGIDAAAPRRLYLYHALWPWHWDFYLYRVEFVRIKYRKTWTLQQIRETMLSRVVEPCVPLFSIKFFEPQAEYSFKDQEYVPDVEDTEEVSVEPLNASMVNLSFPLKPSLADIARLAFPVTTQERTEARARVLKRKVAKKAERPQKAPVARKAVRKLGGKSSAKRAAKKVARKGSAKKAVRKSVRRSSMHRHR